MTNFIELNMKNSSTSLKFVDTELKAFKVENMNVIKPIKACDVCGVPSSITKLFDGLCKDCAKHYTH